jgi:lincosamide nucleotidyltransferase
VLVQERLIARVRSLCAEDDRLDSALMYGSFPAGDGDAYSDVEFWLFFRPERRPDVDPEAWCAQVAPTRHLVWNEFGTVVAFFAGLIRGEFHFATTDDIASVAAWPARGAPVDRMLVLDRSGALRPVLEGLPRRSPAPGSAAEIGTLCGRYANWLVLAHSVVLRGETLRAWDALGHVHRHLLWMARLLSGQTTHWLTPSRSAETELPPAVVVELRATTGAAEPAQVREALVTAWQLGRRYWVELAELHGLSVPEALFAELDDAIAMIR